MANGRCRIHGGKSLAGIASPTFKHGRYSRYLPQRLQGRYTESLNDPDLLVMRADIALLDGRLEDLLHRVDSGESGESWTQAKATFRDLSAAIRSGNADQMASALTALERIINRGLGDYLNWQEIGNTLEGRRRLVDSERKRLVDLQQMIPAERAMILIGAIGEIIRKNVKDPDTLGAIQRDLTMLLNQQQSVDAGGEG